jgi:hypothetical protein
MGGGLSLTRRFIMNKQVTERALEIIEECGELPVSTIDDLGKFQEELEQLGYVSYLDASTGYLIVEKAE